MAIRPSFKSLFEQAYADHVRHDGLRSLTETIEKAMPSIGEKALPAPRVPDGIGHPDYQHLRITETEEGTIVAFFMDIRGFTKVAIALDNQEVVRILQATLAASIAVIAMRGGHVADLTGDGIMALFGGRYSTDENDAFNALAAGAELMRGMREVVQPRLGALGYETVKIGIGIEYGTVLWTRLGLPIASQVKPISGISFLAGKLCTGKYTNAWEAKIGENLAEFLPPQYVTRTRAYEFQHDGKAYRHGIFLFDWEAFGRDYALDPLRIEQLPRQRRLPQPRWPKAAAIAAAAAAPGQAGPRPLKDQPFFAPAE